MPAKNAYRSTLRARQAARTREEILQAARELFAERGYAPTTITDIADKAEVSPQTVYTAFTSKTGLAIALVDYGNRESGAQRMGRDVMAAPTPIDMIGASVHLVCVLHERIGDLIRVLVQAAQVDPSLGPTVAAGRASHAIPQRRLAERLAAAGVLRDGWGAEAAADLLVVMTSPEAVERYVREREWTYVQIEQRLTDAVVHALCAPDVAAQPWPKSS